MVPAKPPICPAAFRPLGGTLVLLLALLWAGAAAAQAPGEVAPAVAQPAQQQPAEAQAAPAAAPFGDIEVRVHLTLIDQLSYTVHPFYQITEDPGYGAGHAATTGIFNFGTRQTDENTNFLGRALHSLPPFGIEGVMGLDVPFPRGFSFGFDYSPFTQTDTEAAEGAVSVIPIRMDAFYYSGAMRFYFFDPTEPGANYFVGFGLGLIEGTVKAEPFTGVPAEFLSLSQFPVGSTRLGLEARGDTWGFRYELMIISAREVSLESNPYPDFLNNGPNPTTIDFSGSIVRLSLFFQF